MKSLAKFVRFCFGLESLSLLSGVPLLFVAATMVRRHGSWDGASYSSETAQMAALWTLALGLDIVPAIAWWMLKKGKPSARFWALAASAANFPLPISGLNHLRSWTPIARSFHLPPDLAGAAIGVAGLIAFSRPPVVRETADSSCPKPQRAPGDGTSAWADRVAYIFGIAWLLFALGWWRRWAGAQDLPATRGLAWLFELWIAVFLNTVGHELGHLLAGQMAGMRLRSIRIGPLSWAIRNGTWTFTFEQKGLLGGGSVGHAPLNLSNIRRRRALTILGGPVASLLLGAISGAAALHAKGSPWESLWSLLAMVAALALGSFILNLIPQNPESHYSDGAQLYQMLTNGQWAQIHLAFEMVAASLASSVRPRDWDVDLINSARQFLKTGQRGMLLQMFACQHYLESGQTPEAIAALEIAEGLYDKAATRRAQDFCGEFAFYTAVFKRDPADAELWWKRLEAESKIDCDADYWLGRTAILWLRGAADDAQSAWERGHQLALELPAFGAYEHTRWCFERLKETLQSQPPSPTNLVDARQPVAPTEA